MDQAKLSYWENYSKFRKNRPFVEWAKKNPIREVVKLWQEEEGEGLTLEFFEEEVAASD